METTTHKRLLARPTLRIAFDSKALFPRFLRAGSAQPKPHRNIRSDSVPSTSDFPNAPIGSRLMHVSGDHEPLAPSLHQLVCYERLGCLTNNAARWDAHTSTLARILELSRCFAATVCISTIFSTVPHTNLPKPIAAPQPVASDNTKQYKYQAIDH